MQKKSKATVVVSLCLFVAIAARAAFGAQGGSRIAGNWMSKPGQFKIVFRASQNTDGSFNALTDIPDQEAWDMPADLTVSDSSVVTFDMYNIRCVYEGRISADGMTIDGQFKGPDGGCMPLVLERVAHPPVRTSKRPQEPKKPYPYRAEEVSFENRIDGVTLAGTLTLPESDGPYPAALLVSGSGPNDRDQLIWGHRTFLVLADYLTRHGMAVLRFDDRGVGRSTGDYDSAMFDDFKRDVLAGLEYLKTRPDIDAGKIGLIGHSEGGAIAPMAASASPDVAYLVLMAAPGASDDVDGLLKQFADVYRARGTSEKAISLKCSILDKTFYIVRHEDDVTAARQKIRQILQNAKQELSNLSEDERRKIELESVDTYEFDWMLAPEFRSILRYSPNETLMKVKCPVLAMNGDRDVQMPKECLSGIKAALAAGGNHRCTIKELPGLNHLFQTATTGSPAEYPKIEETLSPAALAIISDWIRKEVSIR
jgi:pimeloyl-ACP methyl ester carboxylesterase